MWPLSTAALRRLLSGAGGDGAGTGGDAHEGDWQVEEVKEGEEIGGATGSLNDLAPGDLFVALPFVDGDAHAHVEEALGRGAGLALVSEAWPGTRALAPELRGRCVVVEDVLPAFRGLAAVFRRSLPCPVVAVIGCNGKTTTKEMLAAMLSSPGRRVVRTPGTDNGFLGLPRTLCSREIRREAPPDAVVLEIGIDAVGAMAEHARMAAPDMVVIAALGPEHLDGLGDVETAIAEELVLCARCPSARRVVSWGDAEIRRRRELVRPGDVAVVEEAALRDGQGDWPPAESVLVFRATTRGADSEVAMRWIRGGEGAAPVWRGDFVVPMPGAHNARNFALAFAAGLALGRSPGDLRLGFDRFEPPAWRSGLVPLAGGALLYEDCFNASPPSLAAALAAMSDPAWAHRPKVLILGDMLDLAAESERWHREPAGAIAAMPSVRVYLFGRAMAALGEALREIGHGDKVARWLEGGDPVDLVRDLRLSPGAIVLVKGSRGMRMERVSRHLRRTTRVLITGSYGARAAADQVERALGCFGALPSGLTAPAPRNQVEGAPAVFGAFSSGLTAPAPGNLATGGFEAVMVPHGDIAAAVASGDFEVGVFTGLSEADLPEGGSPEMHLAEKAQAFLRARGLRAVVLDADDPASELLAEVLPPGVRVLRHGTSVPKEATPLDLRATSTHVSGGGGGEITRVHLAGSPDFPAWIDLRGSGAERVRGALAALLVVLALGGSPRQAARHLC
jgi:UDP-N-acetylmuramoyl-tripeptide--D-alanyl-D-alanine ligase